jgi:hypothetical protein
MACADDNNDGGGAGLPMTDGDVRKPAYEPPLRVGRPPRALTRDDPVCCHFCCPIGEDARFFQSRVGPNRKDRERPYLGYNYCGGCRDDVADLLAPVRELRRRLVDGLGDRNVVAVPRKGDVVDTDWRLADKAVGAGNDSHYHPVYVDDDAAVWVRVHRTEPNGNVIVKTVPLEKFWSLNKHLLA